MLWQFVQIVNELSMPIFWENKKNIVNYLSAELAENVKVKLVHICNNYTLNQTRPSN